MDINITLLGQLITFAVLVWFTMKYVWPPIMKAMHEREKKIAAGLDAALRSKQALEMAEHKALDIIHEAKLESTHILDLAHQRALQIIDEAKSGAKEESQRLLERAQDEITREMNQAKEVLRKQLAVLAVAGAEKILKKQLDIDTQSDLLKELVAEI